MRHRMLAVGARVAAAGFLVLLMVAASASAAITPPFTAYPSYAGTGAFGNSLTLAFNATGAGYNHVQVKPKFSLVSGTGKGWIFSRSNGTPSAGSGYVDEAFIGLQNLSFACPSNCTTGIHRVTANWTITWNASMQSNCPAVVSSSYLTGVYGGVDLEVWNTSGRNAKDVKVGVDGFVDNYLTSPGSATFGAFHTYYQLSISPRLVSGYHYMVLTVIQEVVYTYAKSAIGALCSSEASVSAGVTHKAILNWVSVT
jgi:hypothetical protein